MCLSKLIFVVIICNKKLFYDNIVIFKKVNKIMENFTDRVIEIILKESFKMEVKLDNY